MLSEGWVSKARMRGRSGISSPRTAGHGRIRNKSRFWRPLQSTSVGAPTTRKNALVVDYEQLHTNHINDRCGAISRLLDGVIVAPPFAISWSVRAWHDRPDESTELPKGD